MTITAYRLSEQHLQPVDPFAGHGSLPVWLDLLHITPEEEQLVEHWLGIDIPTRAEMREIESSSRFYTENGAVYANVVVVVKSNTPEPESHDIGLVCYKGMLITIRYSEPYSFTLLAQRRYEGSAAAFNGHTLLAEWLEIIVSRMADMLEDSGQNLDVLNRTIFRPSIQGRDRRSQTRPDYDDILRQIGVSADLCARTRESLWHMERMLSGMTQYASPPLDGECKQRVKVVQKDIATLAEHVTFQSSKVNLLLDATLGMTNIEQSGIIKIFSVASVVFLPPTLVASIYGMNFTLMPELKLTYGYPLALVMMVLSALLPYLYFKRKKWL